MPSVTYVSYDGKSTTLDVPLGTSVMQAAVLNGVDGIVAEVRAGPTAASRASW
jgi:2Fe-2S ferredoxin